MVCIEALLNTGSTIDEGRLATNTLTHTQRSVQSAGSTKLITQHWDSLRR